MAQKTTITLIDDLTGESIEDGAGATIPFGVDGVTYEIDLTNEHADELRAALAPYLEKARKVSRTSGARGAAKSGGARRSKQDLGAVREWLRSKGHEISDRGRIPEALLSEYYAANR